MASRERAREEIAAGRVTVRGAPALTPARLVQPDEPVVLAGPGPRYVSRGGEKLAAALETFAVDPSGREALDAGASTGGFTDCLLQRGAAHVTAVDVGRGQLHDRLRHDPRVTVLEQTNVRHLTLESLSRPRQPFDVVVADLSFISLRLVARALADLAGTGCDLVVLVKPQFEAGRPDADRGRGVISDPDLWRRALAGVDAAFAEAGAAMMGLMVSPLLGPRGNVEFLAHLVARPDPPPPALGGAQLDAVVEAAARLRRARKGG